MTWVNEERVITLHQKELQGNAYLDWVKKQPLEFRQKLQKLFSQTKQNLLGITIYSKSDICD